MFNPIAWLCNLRHRKLIEESKELCRLSQFLDECGLKEVWIPTSELKKIKKILDK